MKRDVQHVDQVADQPEQVHLHAQVAKLEGGKVNIDQENRSLKRPESSKKVVPLADIKLRWREGPQALQGMK